MQIEGDEDFNKWARETAVGVAEKDNRIVYITITELKPVRSRIEKLKLELAAKPQSSQRKTKTCAGKASPHFGDLGFISKHLNFLCVLA